MKNLILILILFLVLSNGSTCFSQSQPYNPKNSKIVSVDWLSEHLNDPDLVILHVAPLRGEYIREHIPGARFLWNSTLTTSTPDEAAIPVSVKTIKNTLEELGISNNSKIVLTFMNGLLVSTCRTYLMLDYIGLGDQTYILSGGVEQWKAEGQPVGTDIPVPKKGNIEVSLNKDIIYTSDQVLKSLNLPNTTLIDARAVPYYEGKIGVPRAGRIPGAKNLSIAKLYEENTIKFLSEDKLMEEFQKAGIGKGNELITYCFVGNAASLVYFVARELGYKVHLYDGSMDEWGNRFDLPLEKDELKKEKVPDNVIPFESDLWNKQTAKVVDYLGRKSLMGIATLKDVDFINGVIEFDLAVNGERSYPGVTFRRIDQNNYERIYIRPHLSKVFENVIQYEGTFNGLDSWQLYYGPGKTSTATFPVNEWFHVKIEIKDTQAKLYLVDMEKPLLTITELAHGLSKGSLGVWGPMDGSAYFSNFSYRADNTLKFTEPPKIDLPLGMITDWELSQPFKATKFDLETFPNAEELNGMKWKKVQSLPSGLLDISRYNGRLSQSADIIWAKTELNSDMEQSRQFAFGYSDMISIFLNGKLLFSGNSSYTSRDANFQGILGLNDYIFLPLKKGKNELMIAVAEQFGGWGFMFQDANAVYLAPGMEKQWEIRNEFKYPESVVYDKKRDVLYVSNFTFERDGFISKVSMKGEIEKIDWITGIVQPTGLCIYNDKLFVVGRFNLIEYDLEKNAITNRYPFPEPVFANDVASDESGTLFISDGAKGAIYKLEMGAISEWVKGNEFIGANGILVDNGKVYVGTSHDGSLKSIDISTKKISPIYTFSKPTIIDGLLKDGHGSFLISDNEGRLFRISKEGKEELLLNTKAGQINIADFEYIPGKGMYIIPTLYNNKVMVYRMK